MGWNTGGDIMSTIIENYKAYNGGPYAYDRIRFYMNIIKEFEDRDCDVLEECMGVDRWYDAAILTVRYVEQGQSDQELAEEITQLCSKSSYASLTSCLSIHQEIYGQAKL